MQDARQELIEARNACRRFVITARTGAIRPYPRAEPIGSVVFEDCWIAFVGNLRRSARNKRDAAESVLYERAGRIAEAFLVDLVERLPDRLADIRLAVLTPWRDDPNALGGLCSERDLERALRAVAINKSVREAAE